MLLMTNWRLFCFQSMSFDQNLLQMVFRQICETHNLRVFLIRLYFCCFLDPDLKGQCRLKNGQFFSGFFHILKRRKTALKLKRRQLCSQIKKKCLCHLIYARECVKKDFVHSGLIGLIQGKHAPYVIMCFNIHRLSNNFYDRSITSIFPYK